MDKIAKSIKNLDSKTSQKIVTILTLLYKNQIEGLDIKKLRGHKNIFRIRVGDYRIVYQEIKTKKYILFIGKRNEKIYKNY